MAPANTGTASNNRFFKSGNPGVHGDYNTYKFESRFTLIYSESYGKFKS